MRRGDGWVAGDVGRLGGDYVVGGDYDLHVCWRCEWRLGGGWVAGDVWAVGWWLGCRGRSGRFSVQIGGVMGSELVAVGWRWLYGRLGGLTRKLAIRAGSVGGGWCWAAEW